MSYESKMIEFEGIINLNTGYGCSIVQSELGELVVYSFVTTIDKTPTKSIMPSSTAKPTEFWEFYINAICSHPCRELWQKPYSIVTTRPIHDELTYRKLYYKMMYILHPTGLLSSYLLRFKRAMKRFFDLRLGTNDYLPIMRSRKNKL